MLSLRCKFLFAHTGATCRAVARDEGVLRLPLYDRFNLQLTGMQLQALRTFAAQGKDGISRRELDTLQRLELVQFNTFARGGRGAWELTKLGKIPVGQLSLHLFNQVQEPMLLDKLMELEMAAVDASDQAGQPDLAERLTDLRIYQAQLRRILGTTLYLLQIDADGEQIYKIGVTARPVEERAAEVHRDLHAHFSQVVISVLGTWPHRGNVELYFKYRYHAQQRLVGDLTEYFSFADPAPVLRDLRRMASKELSEIERDILRGELNPVEVMLALEERARRRSAAIRGRGAGAVPGEVSAGRCVARPGPLDPGRCA